MGVEHLVVEMKDSRVGGMKKDLSRIGRDLNKVILVDTKRVENRSCQKNLL